MTRIELTKEERAKLEAAKQSFAVLMALDEAESVERTEIVNDVRANANG